MEARYADGRAAVTHTAACALEADAIVIAVNGASLRWPYDALARADDGSERIMLKRRPDTGERLMLALEHADALRAAAPALFTPRAHGVESPLLVGGLAAASLSLAAAFLVGVPFAAEPIARLMPQGYRDQISQLAWAQVDSSMELCSTSNDADGQGALFDLTDRLDAHFERAMRENVEVYVMHADMPNAFTLPDDSIIITDQLISFSESPEELAGVIAHELGHVEGRHVMSNIVRRLGAGVFFDIFFGGAGLGQALAIGSSSLTSLGYSREDETDADTRGLDMMERAHIDPQATAALFERIAAHYPESAQVPELLSSHPAHAARAAAARARAGGPHAPALDQRQWRAVRAMCGMAPPPGAPSSGAPTTTGKSPAAAPPPVEPVVKGAPI